MKKIIHFIYKLKHYFKKPEKVVPRARILKPKIIKCIMQEQVDMDTAMELARQWDREDVTAPHHRR